ncbi:MAG: MFS transporter [Gaiellaceae bacterium]
MTDDDRRRRLTLFATALGSSLAFLDATVVVVALPTIERDLGLGLSGQQWVFLSYSLALAALYLFSGAVGDRRGRREVFLVGVAGFALASLLAGAAPSGGVLILARTLQGVAGAFVTTNSLALLREVYGREAGRAIGLWTALTAVATVIGPPLGGALVEWASWRWIFLINLPLAAATVALALAGRCRVRERQRTGALDLPGAALAAVGLAALTYGLVEGADRGFAATWWLLIVGVTAAAAFLVVEHRSSEPMLPLAVFRRRNFAAANLETFLVYAALSGVSLFSALYLQFLGLSPFEAGLTAVPVSIALIVLSGRFGGLADRRGPRLLLTVGPLGLGLATLLLATVDDTAELWFAGSAALVVFSVGLAMIVAPITATALKAAPPEYAGIASGVNTTLSRLGGLLAVAVVGVVVTLVFEASGGSAEAVPLATGQEDPELRAASVDGFRAGMTLVAALAFSGAAVAAVGISNREARAEATAEPAGS